MNIEPSDAFAIRINSHRHLWKGQIRANPIQWNCEAPDSFREIRCESGSERCYHLHVLASGAPRVVVLDQSAERLLADNPALLDDQLHLFYGSKFELRRGRSQMPDLVVYGAYRVKRARIETKELPRAASSSPFPTAGPCFRAISFAGRR